MSDEPQIIDSAVFDDVESCGRYCVAGVWTVRIPTVFSPSIGFITARTNHWMTDRSMVRELLEECRARDFNPAGLPVHWIEVQLPGSAKQEEKCT